MSLSLQRNDDGDINVNADGDVIAAAAGDACCCVNGWHVARRCPDEGSGTYGEAIYFRVGFVCDGCPLNGGRIVIVGGLCYEVEEDLGLPDEECNPDGKGVVMQRPAKVIEELPDEELETPWADITCKEREATCEDAECVPIGPRECCLAVPPAEDACRCRTWSAGRNHGPCAYGQLVRIRWVYFERGQSWCASEPTGSPGDCVQTDEETFVGDGEMIGVYECMDDSGLGFLTAWEGSVTRTHTNGYCPESAPAYSHTLPWVPPSVVDLWDSVAHQGESVLPYVPGEAATVGSCCGSCTGVGGTSTNSNMCSGGGFCTVAVEDAFGGRSLHDEYDSCAVSGIIDELEQVDTFCLFPRCEKERTITAAITTLERCQEEAGAVGAGAGMARVRAFAVEDWLG